MQTLKLKNKINNLSLLLLLLRFPPLSSSHDTLLSHSQVTSTAHVRIISYRMPWNGTNKRNPCRAVSIYEDNGGRKPQKTKGKKNETKTKNRSKPDQSDDACDPLLGDPHPLRLAGAHALMPLATASSMLLLLLAS